MANVYEIVTEKFVEAMEKDGLAPWQKTWKYDQWPKNLVSKKEYTGVNVWLLAIMGHNSPWWATYKQIQNLGGVIKEEERKNYAIITFYQPVKRDEQGEEVQRAILKYYRVWNTNQTENMDNKIPDKEQNDYDPIEMCEEVIRNYKEMPKIMFGPPSYNMVEDIIRMPEFGDFETPQNYYGTLFHECIHSTGFKSRLNRFTKGTLFGSETYSFEELVAEIGASFLCSMTNVDLPRIVTNQQSYVKHWVQKLNADKTLILKASSAAKKAVEYMGVSHE